MVVIKEYLCPWCGTWYRTDEARVVVNCGGCPNCNNGLGWFGCIQLIQDIILEDEEQENEHAQKDCS